MLRGRVRRFSKAVLAAFSNLRRYSDAPKMDPCGRYCYKPTLKWNTEVEEYFSKAYGAQHFSRISDALTRPSCYSCIRVNILKSTSDAVIEKLMEILSKTGAQNDAFAESNTDEINKSSLELHKNADCLKVASLSDSISKCPIPELDYVVFVKGSGPHTIDYGYVEGRPPKEILVSRKCAEAVLRGAQVYVPGVLACSAHVEKGDVVAVSVAVEQPNPVSGWAIGMTRGTVLQRSQADPYYIERHGLYIGQGTTLMSRAGIFRATQGVAVDMSNRVYQLPSFNEKLEGEIFLQNLPSIIAAHALDPQPGERILDMCAAPGGKTTAIATLMKDKGEVVAADRSHNKVLDIQKLAAELNLNCITTCKLDALKAVKLKSDGVEPSDVDGAENSARAVNSEQPRDMNHNYKVEVRKNLSLRNGPGRNNCSGGRVEKSKGFPPNSFDRVLVDAPCSALGLRPRLFSGEETVESLRNHAKYQRRMFDQAIQLVRSGGVIVYSTCTINPGENESLVRYALDAYKFLSLAPQNPRVGGPGLTGGCQFSDGYMEEWLRPGEEELVQRFDPCSPLDTIGFFIAKFNVGPKDT